MKGRGGREPLFTNAKKGVPSPLGLPPPSPKRVCGRMLVPGDAPARPFGERPPASRASEQEILKSRTPRCRIPRARRGFFVFLDHFLFFKEKTLYHAPPGRLCPWRPFPALSPGPPLRTRIQAARHSLRARPKGPVPLKEQGLFVSPPLGSNSPDCQAKLSPSFPRPLPERQREEPEGCVK